MGIEPDVIMSLSLRVKKCGLIADFPSLKCLERTLDHHHVNI